MHIIFKREKYTQVAFILFLFPSLKKNFIVILNTNFKNAETF